MDIYSTDMEIDKPLSDGEIDELERFLNSGDVPERALNISSLHGFLTALVASPSLVPPSQWLPVVWGGGDPTFDSKEKGGHILGLLLRFYNSISHTLEKNPDEFSPILLEDASEDDLGDKDNSSEEGYLIAQDWCDGFSHGVGLCSADWERLFSDDKARNLLAPIIAFTSPDAMADVLEKSGKKVNREMLIAFLPLSVVAIYDYWREARRKMAATFASGPSPVHAVPKVGRNDPCPCGSGRKYKKCCERVN